MIYIRIMLGLHMVEGKMSVYLREGTSREIEKEQLDFVACICRWVWPVMLHKLSEMQTLAEDQQVLLNSCSQNQSTLALWEYPAHLPDYCPFSATYI